jgi:hypothetical protein
VDSNLGSLPPDVIQLQQQNLAGTQPEAGQQQKNRVLPVSMHSPIYFADLARYEG